MSFAALFPGQGSQSLGMLKDLESEFPIVSETFSEASEVVSKDLWKLCQEGPETDLNATDNTQPVMLVAGVAIWRVWVDLSGCEPSVMAGHSLGEYTALVCSGALTFDVAVELVAERGRLMQEAVPDGVGAMAAILGLSDDEVQKACADASQGQIVSAVNFNSPGQVVIAGEKSAVERACEVAKEAGAKRALVLPVSVPSHCSLMEPAAKKLAEKLADIEISVPDIPVIHNVNVQSLNDSDEIRHILVSQLYSPVRWVETIQSIAQSDIAKLAEFGPGKVLTGLSKRIDRSFESVCAQDPETLKSALQWCL